MANTLKENCFFDYIAVSFVSFHTKTLFTEVKYIFVCPSYLEKPRKWHLNHIYVEAYNIGERVKIHCEVISLTNSIASS